MRIGAKSGRRQLESEAMEHRGGEDTLTEEAARQPYSGGWPRLFLPDCASDLKATASANLVYPSRKAARKIAAPLARKDGSHNAPSYQASSPRVRIEA